MLQNLPTAFFALIPCFLTLKLMYLQEEYSTIEKSMLREPKIIEKECEKRPVEPIEVDAKSEANTKLIWETMYKHPDDENIRGRPFSGLEHYGHILQEYLDVPAFAVEANSNKDDPNASAKGGNVNPQLVTAISSIHFEDFKYSIPKVFEKFGDKSLVGDRVIVYDLGLELEQLKYFANLTKVELRKFNYSKYPEQTKWLPSKIFQIMIIKDCLMEFKSCLWFDSNFHFTKNADDLVQRYVYGRKSSFVYFAKPFTHTPAWATHPFMYGYLPTNITKHVVSNNYVMGHAGGILLVNTEDFKQNFMRFAIACALTPECMMPNYPLNEHRMPWGTKFNPYGDFEYRHCDKKNQPGRPYNCHKFNHSLWMILVSNAYSYSTQKFRAASDDFIGYIDESKTVKEVETPPWQLVQALDYKDHRIFFRK